MPSNHADALLELPRPSGPMRLFANPRLPYFIVSCFLLAAWAVVAGTVGVLTGELAQSASSGHLVRIYLSELLQGTLVVYLLTCEHLARREVARDLGQLRHEVESGTTDFEEIVRSAFFESRLIRWLNVFAPLLGCIAMVEFDPAIWIGRPKPDPTSSIYLWAVVRNSLLGWALARLVTSEIRWTRTYVNIARHLGVPLPRGALTQPFVRKGLHSAAIWLIFSSLFSLFWVGNSAGTANPLLFAVALAFATYALFVPLRAIRSTVRDAKLDEFVLVDREIAAERGPLVEGRSEDSARLASLVAWRSLVERVDEWPLSAPAAFRFSLYVLLGLGSWLGGALVERGVDVFLQ